ncbi:uncharacterized protein LOC143604386 [Bidens hawaiensis]|uniref:uncharacterized protein LOC143604386 n=1 Tax=Bidens hawaiensis TaxID=980011 RepID=UPI0040495D7E
MMHGPCGVANPKCSCIDDNSCSKEFPKKFQNETSIDSNGFPVYRRRDLGNVVVKSAVNLDNRHVVPYNSILLKKYQAHINVQWCNQEGSIKNVFKYLSICEAVWRIFAFDVHYRVPSVTRLPFHLTGQQTFVFADDDNVEDVLNKSSVGSSKFIAWMECNQQYGLARTLTYAEFPTKFVWKPLKGFGTYVKGPMCFEDIRTVDGEVCATYRDACYKKGLLDNDNEYIEAIEETSHTASGYYLRSLFATMLITYSLSRPDDVWEKYEQRQILPVVQHGSRSDIVNASVSSSHIWTKCKVLKLTKNTRLTVGCQSSNLEDTIRFAEWLLDLGEGKLGGDNDGNAIIEIPDDLLIRDSSDPLSDLIDFGILAPLNEVVEEINDIFLCMFPGEEVEYLSSDSLDKSESVGPGFDAALHSSDFLNE